MWGGGRKKKEKCSPKHSCSLPLMKSYRKSGGLVKTWRLDVNSFKYQDGYKGLVDFLPIASSSQRQSCAFRHDNAGSNLGASGKRPQGRTNSSLRWRLCTAQCVSIGWTCSLGFCWWVWTLNFKMMAEDRKTFRRHSTKARRKALLPKDD